ncbi:hypothetical protein FACS189428_4470 [Clostridia bacterium]|nr:hypothetical protein FACS189428_4470 [Clostridia bacterium]
MNNTLTPKSTSNLATGTISVYPFKAEGITLHVYHTGNFANDQTFLLETEKNLIAIEAPALYKNISALQTYITQLKKPLNDALISYHPAGGGDAFPEANLYATASTKEAMTKGETKHIIDGFVQVFGEEFNSTIPKINKGLAGGNTTIAGVKFVIIPTPSGYDIEIPDINVIYTHMLGADSHSILAGEKQIKSLISTLKGYKKADYNLILTSHHTPETLADVDTKIAYLRQALEIITHAKTAGEFIQQMKTAFPNYLGENYLEMSAGMLYN